MRLEVYIKATFSNKMEGNINFMSNLGKARCIIEMLMHVCTLNYSNCGRQGKKCS